ncbi:MAG: hypothetical protein HYR88_11090 [Verrucomicrobia bacterium]|nr:hypothetical protein [Verrucomicrobiota bacterium]MBI3869458.1 hypothetical protein [Verrucomicrobiota bacterium]
MKTTPFRSDLALALLLTLSALSFVGCGDKSSEPAKSSTSGGNPLTAPVDYLGAVAKSQKTAGNKLSTVNLKQAIQSYQAQEGKLPKELQDLVKAGILPSLPTPPQGMQFSYDAKTGDVKVVAQ